MVSKAIVLEIPKLLWEGDFLVDLENDIKFLEHHFQCGVNDMLWVRETHRLHIKTNPTDPEFRQVWVEYMDGETRQTTLLPEEVAFEGRKTPPIAMKKLACRFILRVKEIGVRWLDEAKKTRLVWVVGVERMPNVDYVLEQERRNALK